MDIELDGQSVRRLVRNLLWLGTLDGPLPPERVSLIQGLGTRLGLGPQDLVQLGEGPAFVAPPTRPEAEATYLAALVMFAQSHAPSAQDRTRLIQLGKALELGFSIPQLHQHAQAGAALAGFRASRKQAEGADKEAIRKAGERLRARVSSGRLQALRESSGIYHMPKEVLAEGEAVVRHGQRPRSRSRLPLAVAALFVLAGVGGGVGWYVKQQQDTEPKAPADAADAGEATPRYSTAVAGFRDRALSDPPPSIDDVLAIRAELDEAAGGSDDSPLAVEARGFLASREWRGKWRETLDLYEEQVRDELLVAAQDGRLADVAPVLSSIPEIVSRDAPWPKQLADEVGAWRAFSADVDAFVERTASQGTVKTLAVLEEGYAIRKRGLACQAKPTHAFGVLTTWFQQQKPSADLVQKQAAAKVRERDATALRRYGEILVLLGRPARRYGSRLARSTKAMVLEAVAEGDYSAAKGFLAGLPSEYVPQSWIKKRQGELTRWEAFEETVHKLIDKKPVETDDLAKGREMFFDAGDAKITPAYPLLEKWFRSLGETEADLAYKAFLKAAIAEDELASFHWMEVIVLILEERSRPYIARRMTEDLEGFDLESLKPKGGVGSGFFVAPGKVLTNDHVVAGQKTVTLELGKAKHEGRVAATDSDLDLALIETEARGEAIASISSQVEPGSTVFAFGYGVLSEDTSTLLVTRGAVSARLSEKKHIVFDAHVNPGNSGGPLLDSLGSIVGVVVAKSSSSTFVDSLGYAVDGRAVRAWLKKHGVTLTESAEVAKSQDPPKGLEASVVRIVVGGD